MLHPGPWQNALLVHFRGHAMAGTVALRHYFTLGSWQCPSNSRGLGLQDKCVVASSSFHPYQTRTSLAAFLLLSAFSRLFSLLVATSASAFRTLLPLYHPPLSLAHSHQYFLQILRSTSYQPSSNSAMSSEQQCFGSNITNSSYSSRSSDTQSKSTPTTVDPPAHVLQLLTVHSHRPSPHGAARPTPSAGSGDP